MKRSIVIAALLGIVGSAAAQAPLFSLAYDNPTPNSTNQMRSLAVARNAGNESVYFGFIQGSGFRDVRRHDWNSPYGLLNSRTPASGGDQPKAIATDDRGNVYVANRLSGTNIASIKTHDSALNEIASFGTGSTNDFGGIAWHKSGGTNYLYISREGGGAIQRFNADDPTNIALDPTFGVAGTFTVPGATNLRGIEVASDGTIYVASRNDGSLFKVSADLTTTSTLAISRAFDVALFQDKAYVTSYDTDASKISVIDLGTFAVDEEWTNADIGFLRSGSREGYAGIDIDSLGRIWLVDENYLGSGSNTADRLLVSAPIPTPASAALLGFAGIAAARRRR